MFPSLIFIFALFGAGPIPQTPSRGIVSSGYLVNQNFEGTGYDNGETWTESAAWDEDFTTVPLVGSQSLNGVSTVAARTDFTSFTAQSDVWAYGVFRVRAAGSTWPSGAATWTILRFTDSSAAILAQVQLRPSNKFRVTAGGNSIDSTGTLSADTTYHFRFHYTAGNGATALGSIEFSTDGTFTGGGSLFISLSTGSSTASAARIYTVVDSNGGVGMDEVFDHILVSATTIGNNP